MESEPPCIDVVIVAAIDIELDPLRQRLTNRRVERGVFRTDFGQLGTRNVAIVESGVGRENATKAVSAVVSAFCPKLVISCGLAGGLSDGLDVGDVLFATSVLLGDDLDGRSFKFSGHATGSCHRGPVVTVDRAVLDEDSKRKLAKSSGAFAVDMETYAAALWCSQNAVNMIAVRAISDAVGDTLPAVVGTLVGANVWEQTGRVAGTLVRRPLLVKDLWKLRSRALLAADRLANSIEEIVVALEDAALEGKGVQVLNVDAGSN